ncbi:Flp family type IVb pilin [Vibrio azureus]|uniref:Fimbrial protein n=1 Tax=Vibrio azureus NBRC 104587 TaxID=1219077 RepID=U3A333_9VIBR|nr:hypothetical protein [Vibrio azureus]GAD74391.1 hypothetical protein VAZ01S_010_00440 [Vibrio azureus NBRC 104587]
MDKLRNLFVDFVEDEEGLTLLEYILGAALLVAALLTSGFWDTIATKFSTVSTQITNS